MTTAMKQDSQTSRDDEKECDAVRRFKSSNDKVELVSEFYTMIMYDSNPVADLKSMIDVCPDILSYGYWITIYGTPLHFACLFGRSSEVIELLVELLVQRNPEALQVAAEADAEGNLPLHHMRSDCSLSVIKLLVDTYPLSVQVKNRHGKTPLHSACERRCSFEQIAYLVQLYPQALQIKDKQGCTPIHYACRYNKDLSVIQLLHTSFTFAVRWKNNDGVTPLAPAYKWASAEIIEYIAYECWPVACALLYISKLGFKAKPKKKCLEDATMEVVAALVDIACHAHVKHVLPDTVTAHIAESVMLSDEKSKTMKKLPTELSPGQHDCETVLDKLDCHTKLDHSTLLTILESEKVQCLLEPEGGHNELQELLDSVIQMNRAGRCAYLADDVENKRQGMKVLESTATKLSGLYYHVRENPLICQQRL